MYKSRIFHFTLYCCYKLLCNRASYLFFIRFDSHILLKLLDCAGFERFDIVFVDFGKWYCYQLKVLIKNFYKFIEGNAISPNVSSNVD